jgi:hypothetical protein
MNQFYLHYKVLICYFLQFKNKLSTKGKQQKLLKIDEYVMFDLILYFCMSHHLVAEQFV